MKQKKPSVRKWRGLTSTAAAVMALVQERALKKTMIRDIS